MTAVSETAALLALLARTDLPWHWVGTLAERARGARRLLAGELDFVPGYDQDLARQLAAVADPSLALEFTRLLPEMDSVQEGRLTTNLDAGYPDELRMMVDRPPLLFTQGRDLSVGDCRMVTILGSPVADADTREWATKLAVELVEAGVGIASGLWTPVDRDVLTAALDAGGRAVAVFDRPLAEPHPSEASELARRLRSEGTLVSPCWPTGWPALKHPMSAPALCRAIRSGLGGGVVAIDGAAGSEPHAQVQQSVRTRKHVLLPRALREPWVALYTEDPIVKIVETAGAVLEVVEALTYVPPYLSDVG